MAVWEAKKQAKSGNQLSQVSWTDGVAQDVYYWEQHSFQYSENINCDDELHGIKLANKIIHTSSYAWCDLVAWGDYGVYAMPVNGGTITRIKCNGSSISSLWTAWSISSWNRVVPGTIFQDYFWCGINLNTVWGLYRVQNGGSSPDSIAPYDHPEATDESISDPATKTVNMQWNITAILNYNNTRLVVAAWASIWVYYPELDRANPRSPYYDSQAVKGQSWWKKVLDYEAWVTIVSLTCTFEYLKVRAVDEGRNTKVYYYQGNNNLRDTFVYNVVDLSWERVLRAYSINGTDYFITSIDGTDGYVNLNKMIGNVPVMLFHQRAWLDPLDINYKAPYFVGPTGIKAAYKSGRFYVADAYGVFQFKQTPASYDKWYMKWKFSTKSTQVYWVCENWGFLYVSTNNWCYAMRIYDTWVDGYESKGVMISREMEGKEGGTVTKMLDQIRLNYELNPDTNNTGTIEVYVSPNNLWKSTSSFTVANNRYPVMSITSENKGTRTEKSELFNDLQSWNSAFRFDWQTITYAIVLKQNTSTHATPIVRQIDIRYHCKDKTNNVYDIN